MIASLIILSFSLVSGVVAAWEKHYAPKQKKRAVGLLALVILVSSLVAQGALAVYKGMEEESLNTFLETQETTIEEASGATFWNDNIFVVDDESPSVYEYEYDEALGKAKQRKRYQILPEQAMQSKTQPPISQETVAKVDDLEAAATYDGKLYVISSHSLDKKNKRKDARELILEIGRRVTFPKLPNGEERVKCPEGEGLGNAHAGEAMACVKRAASLAPVVRKALKEAGLGAHEDEVNIEGLAIDEKGVVYIGLRNPPDSQSFAFLLQTTVESVFSESPEVRVIRLRLHKGNDHYGIGSLEYDRKGGTLLILGNGPEKRNDIAPRLWLWHPNPNESDEPPRAAWSLRLPKEFDAKPEALALSGDGRLAFVFIDAPGHGGQRVVSRKALGLPELVAPPCTGKLAEKRP